MALMPDRKSSGLHIRLLINKSPIHRGEWLCYRCCGASGAAGSVNVYIGNNNTSPVTLTGQIAIRYLRP